MIAKVYSAIPYGYNGHVVEVEGDSAKSLPCFNIVGMANKTISEARERVRSAIANSNFIFPDRKVTINLAPADLTKNGTHLDLPIALVILVLSKQLLPSDLDGKLFVGELSLDGKIKSIRGIINIVEAARIAKFKEIYIPRGNFAQASLVPDIKIIGVSSLREAFLHLRGIHTAQTPKPSLEQVKNTTTDYPTLDDITSQALAKRALTIAIAGHHNILLNGPPGAGKTLLARTAAHLAPPPSPSEQIEITKIHTICSASDQIVTKRPFRAPHHTASTTAIIGGGPHATPGEISLAHRGILFLDEIPEYPRSVLESLRQPLEDRRIAITRANRRIDYPADFMLIATMNPCPCGHLGDPATECTCTLSQIESYRKRLSGPIIDRIDIIINIERVKSYELRLPAVNVKNTHTEHEAARQAIQRASIAQFTRYQSEGVYNSSLSPQSISKYIKITPTGQKLLHQATEQLQFSARVYYKIIRTAQTIADLEGSPLVDINHIAEALSLRQQLPEH